MALGAWVFVIFYIDPEDSGMVGKIFFYSSLFLFMSGLWITIFIWIRKRFLGEDAAIKNIGLSFRQGILISIFIVAVVALLGMNYLLWWNVLLILAGIFLLEFYFLSRDN